MGKQKRPFSAGELARYSRHFVLPEIGLEGQQKIRSARVLVVGAGGLGCPVLLYLTAAGVGTIGVVDDDRVDMTNLQRQILYTEDDVGQPKADVAARKLSAMNTHVTIVPHPQRLSSENALSLFSDYDVIVDATDNFPTRYLINDACVLSRKPDVYGAIYRFEGQVSVFNLKEANGQFGPNYRDLFPEPPPPELVPSCAEGGVLGVLPGIIGALQATEVLKIITGVGEPLSGKLLMLDAKTMQFQTIRFRPDPANPLTGTHPTIQSLIDYDWFCQQAGRPEPIPEISVEKFEQWRSEGKPFQLIDVRQPFEQEIVSLGGELIPEGEIPQRVAHIRRDIPVVLYCRSGVRSARVVKQLREQWGYGNVFNLKGGVLAYIQRFRPDWPVY
ncbi:MAG: molybdopterin-synthase adenylyltransferase MoeB [Calditrichaeota bacterium]|nr:molybdopterin-synthase adenylyltransferase MoeB [Calditrichota bacterium]